jgi:hypothetical protein
MADKLLPAFYARPTAAPSPPEESFGQGGNFRKKGDLGREGILGGVLYLYKLLNFPYQFFQVKWFGYVASGFANCNNFMDVGCPGYQQNGDMGGFWH